MSLFVIINEQFNFVCVEIARPIYGTLLNARLFRSQAKKKDQLSTHDAIPSKRVCRYARARVSPSHRERISCSEAKQLSSDEYCSNAIEFPADMPVCVQIQINKFIKFMTVALHIAAYV